MKFREVLMRFFYRTVSWAGNETIWYKIDDERVPDGYTYYYLLLRGK